MGNHPVLLSKTVCMVLAPIPFQVLDVSMAQPQPIRASLFSGHCDWFKDGHMTQSEPKRLDKTMRHFLSLLFFLFDFNSKGGKAGAVLNILLLQIKDILNMEFSYRAKKGCERKICYI